MNRAFLILLFLLLAGKMCAQQVAGTLTLKEAEQRFLERNLSLIAERYNIDMAQAQVLQAKLFENPVISLEQNVYNRLNGKYFDFGKEGEAVVEIEQVIHLAGQRNKQVRLEKINKEIAEYQFEEVMRTLRQELNEKFVEVYFRDKAQSLKDRSIKNKRDTMNAQLLPYFKDRPMNSITPAEIIQWQNTIIEKGYSDDYLKTIQNQMTALFNHAKNIYNLADNPCDKVKRMGKTSKKKMKFWTIEEYRQFMTGIEPGSKYYVLFELLFWTGAREGEALSITPADIDFERNLLHINKTYYRMHGEDVITSPKTEESNRTISIPEFLKKEIQDYISRLYELPEDERIFPMVHEAVQHKLKQVVQKTGVKKIRVHDIRHSHAAFLINKGVQPLMIKERFGHTDIRITLNTYGHLYPDQQKVVADMLDDENIKSSGSTNNRSNVTNGDESTNVNPRQVDYSRDSSREQQRIGENSWENGGIDGTEK